MAKQKFTADVAAVKKKKFTADFVASCKCDEGKKQTIYWDTETRGLGLRVTANGAKSYIFEASLNNKTIRITIGDIRTYPIEGKGEAREKAARGIASKYRGLVDQGKDPRQHIQDEADRLAVKAKTKIDAEIELANKQLRESVTLGEVWSEYIAERKADKVGKDDAWSERHYKDHVKVIHAGGVQRLRSKKLTEAAPLASLAKLKLVDINSDTVTAWANTEATRRPTQARLAFRLLRAFLSWCVTHKVYGQIVTNNPAKNEAAQKRLGKPQVKNDVLQREQLPAWFAAVKQINNPVISAYLQTLLLTGRRREQIAELKWTDIDFQWNKITMKDKTERNPSIPLTPYVAHLLQSLPRRSQYVFSSPTAKSGYLTDPSEAHRKACAEAGVELTLHGLRRSFATLCEWTETPAGVAAQIQGHAPQGVRENNYIRRPLDLLRMWHEKIEQWILEQAGIKFKPVKAGLRAVNS